MNIDAKVKWLGGLLGVCAIAITVESYYLWGAEKSGLDKSMRVDAAFSTALPKVPNSWSGGWDPTGQFQQMQQQMDKLMNQMSTASAMFDQQGFGIATASPQISMQDEAGAYKVVVAVPKGQKIEINTDLSGNTLTIDGKVNQTDERQSNSAREQSLSVSQFSQTLQFPKPVKDSGVKMLRNDNQIVITVPKVS